MSVVSALFLLVHPPTPTLYAFRSHLSALESAHSAFLCCLFGHARGRVCACVCLSVCLSVSVCLCICLSVFMCSFLSFLSGFSSLLSIFSSLSPSCCSILTALTVSWAFPPFHLLVKHCSSHKFTCCVTSSGVLVTLTFLVFFPFDLLKRGTFCLLFDFASSVLDPLLMLFLLCLFCCSSLVSPNSNYYEEL